MPLTFSGTYTQNDGDEVAAGTVTVTHADGTTGTATLDGAGAYTFELDTSGGTVTIVETLSGVPVMTSRTGVTEGVTIDTSRDIGRVGVSQSGASVLSTMQAEANPSPAVSCAQGVSEDVTTWTVDYSSGADITLDGDGKTFHVTAGYYHIRVLANVTRSHGTTSVVLSLSSSGNSESGAVTLVANDNGVVIADQFFTIPDDAPFTVQAMVVGGSAPETLSYAGLDIVRLAPVA